MKITKRQIRKLIKEIRFTTRGPVGGPFAMVWSYFDNGEGWQWKTKSSDEAIAFLPTDNGGPDGSLGYYVKIEHKMGTYNMSWTKRTELPGRRVKVIRPQNGWTVGSVPNEIKTAVDEINNDIAQHETYNYQNEGANVKITKQQLRRIIKEEKAKVLLENAIMGLVKKYATAGTPEVEQLKKAKQDPVYQDFSEDQKSEFEIALEDYNEEMMGF